ncbi:MAG TPA: hypothetical protein VL242_36450 [Sorangium sp.]|nr:hypothetical protein [Sorangium sp.]
MAAQEETGCPTAPRWRRRSCLGGHGGEGGPGGYGGPGRGGDSIGIAYLDEDQLTLEGVTIETGQPGKGGTSWNYDGSTTVGESGEVHETLRFPESLDSCLAIHTGLRPRAEPRSAR